VALFYIVAMACLCLHLDHGIWSMLQTLGWNNARTTWALQALSRGVALVVFVGFISVPVAVLAGWLR
jgi:succinate dehydrogenase / fumarate reductase cytochrome b subunit